MDSEDVTSYEFNLLFVKVNLTVKFPCKMHLRYDNNRISEDVSMTDHSEFIFNQ